MNASCVAMKTNPSRSISRSLTHVTAQQNKPGWKITRGASPSHRLQIAKFLLAEKLNPLSLDMQRFVVATTTTPSLEQQKLIGFGQLKPLDSHSLELSSLVVDPEYRGRGLGKALIAEILAAAVPDKAVLLITVTARRKFYEACGFQEVSPSSTSLIAYSVSIPLSLRIEKMIGSPIAQLAAQDSLIIMKYSRNK
ncbi:hypothetical protein Ndes2526B_g07825 [Nannochloris sp. 'desiccata']|nr:hypothetical protein KSW81_002490 [Chlorella desiccata (nom. nud.)]